MKNEGEDKKGVKKHSAPQEGPDPDLPTIHRTPNSRTH